MGSDIARGICARLGMAFDGTSSRDISRAASMRGLSALLVLGWLAACQPEPIIVPPGSQFSRLILVLETEGEARLFLHAGGSPAIRESIPRDARMTALYYRDQDLGLAPLELSTDPLLSRALPLSEETYEATVHDGAAAAWTRIDAPSDSVKALRIAEKDPETCVDEGGCFGPERDLMNLPYCRASCSAPDEPRPPVAPVHTAIAAPRFVPCPTGWSENGSGTCDPPLFPAIACSFAEAQFLGRDRCDAIGTACPAGAWATDFAPGDRVFYVLAGSAAGGDGSALSPFATIGEAVRTATTVALPGAETVIAVGKGIYPESVRLDGSLRIEGACIEETRIESVGSRNIVEVIGGDIVLRNVAIVDGATLGSRHAVFSSQPARIEIENAVLSTAMLATGFTGGTVFVGHRLYASGPITAGESTIELRDVVVDAVRDSGIFFSGTNARVARVVIRRAIPEQPPHFTGILAQGGQVEIADAVIEAMPLAISYDQAESAFPLKLDRIAITGSIVHGLSLSGSATGSDVFVEPEAGYAIAHRQGRLSLARVRSAGSLATISSTVTIEDFVYDPGSGEVPTRDIAIREGAELTIARAKIGLNPGGIEVEHASLFLRDAIIDGTDVGMTVVSGTLDIERGEVRRVSTALFEGSRTHMADAIVTGPFSAKGPDSVIELRDLSTRPVENSTIAMRLRFESTDVEFLRAEVERQGLAFSACSATVSDLHISDAPDVAISVVGDGTQVSGDRVAIAAPANLGIALRGDNVVSFRDFSIEGAQCVENDMTCGLGVWNLERSHVAIDRFSITGSARAAVRIEGGDLVLSEGRIQDNPVAIELPASRDVGRLEIERLMDRVVFEQNVALLQQR